MTPREEFASCRIVESVTERGGARACSARSGGARPDTRIQTCQASSLYRTAGLRTINAQPPGPAALTEVTVLCGRLCRARKLLRRK